MSKSIYLFIIALTILSACSLQTKSSSDARTSAPVVSQEEVAVASMSLPAVMPLPPSFSGRLRANTEVYTDTPENPIKLTRQHGVSTFSIDVDTGSYTNSRRMLNMGNLPKVDAVRPEEFINYFDYRYQAPTNIDTPFALYTELAPSPWSKDRHLLKIAIKGFEIKKSEMKAANLVFLLDVSGSMGMVNKLPLLKQSLLMLSKQLGAEDLVSIVVYAGAAGVVLEPTKGNDHVKIAAALQQLQAGGPTNGQGGIELAYSLAEQNYKPGGVNRIILATDGDFNLGLSSIDELKALIESKRPLNIALTTLGFGQGNYNDALMEQLADIGNGHHAYIDNINEARKVLVDEVSSTLQVIAKDVKIQVEFNPAQVAEYRLIGYQNRQLKQEDFNNDKVDAGELGAGHTVTALYEITLTETKNKRIDASRYQKQQASQEGFNKDELAYVQLRFKKPDSANSQRLTRVILSSDRVADLNLASNSLQFSAAVAGFAQLLKGGKYTYDFSYQDVIALARKNKGLDDFGYRAEFIQLARTAQTLTQ